MRILPHFFVLMLFALLATSVTQAEDAQAARDHALLEQGRRELDTMRSIYAYVQRKEGEAKAANQIVRQNRLHDITTRIGDLVAVASHAFEDLRIAIASQEPPETAEAEIEKIQLVRHKVDQGRQEADALSDEGQSSATVVQQSDDFGTALWNLTGSDAPMPPVGTPPCPITPIPSGSRFIPDTRYTVNPCR